MVSLQAQDIGIQMISLRHMASQGTPAVLQKIKDLGIKEIEGGAPKGMTRTEFRKMVDQYGLKIISTGASFDHLQNKDSIQKVIRNVKELGVSNVVCYWIPHDGDNFTMDDTQKAIEVFNNAGKTLKENGISLLYHPHGYEFRPHDGGKGTFFDHLVENTNPEYFNFEMDVFWIKNPGQDPVALLKKYPTRWKMLHLKDRKIGTPDNPNGRQDVETNVVLGTGDVGIAAVMKQAMKLGIKHYFIEDESSRAVEQVVESVKYLKSLK
jgi:sugar phosphate isomerase/epimerase